MDKQAVSVVIATYNGAHKINGLLTALVSQTYHDFETVVVVDGSTDGSIALLTSWKTKLPDLKIIEQVNTGRAGARNRGAAEASGELLIFFDDDVLPEERVVQMHIDFHAAHPDSILTGNLPQTKKKNERDFERYRRSLNDVWIKPFATSPFQLKEDNIFMSAANCSVKKDLFVRIGKFLPTLSDAEDREFAVRALRSGVSLYFDKNNRAFHNESLTCAGYIRRLRQYAVANRAVDLLHPGSRSTPKPTGGRLVYRLLAWSPWVWMIDHANIYVLLPKGLRYKLYGAITFALSELYTETSI